MCTFYLSAQLILLLVFDFDLVHTGTKRVTSLVPYAVKPKPVPLHLRQCIQEMKLPCIIGGTAYIQAAGAVIEGGFGFLYKAHRILDGGLIDINNSVMVKIAANRNSGRYSELNSEQYVTSAMEQYICSEYRHYLSSTWSDWFSPSDIDKLQEEPPTIRLIAADTVTPNDSGYEHVVMVMHHFGVGDLESLKGQTLANMLRNPAGFVWKLLVDQSYVLAVMNRHFGWLDNDVKARNILVAGDTRSYRTTSFVKIDYGLSMPIEAAQRQLRSERGRQRGFCDQGTYASPMDVRVVYGAKCTNIRDARTRRQLFGCDEIGAARKLEDEMESVDLLDLAAAALFLYNKLAPDQCKIKLRSYGAGHDEIRRRKTIEYNWRMLNEVYDKPTFSNLRMPVHDIKTLLVRVHWMSFYQLPENDPDAQMRDFLTWTQFVVWLKSARDLNFQTDRTRLCPTCCVQ